MSAVASMACVHCSRLQGREHVAGCPYVVELEAGEMYHYEQGWEAARAALTVEALAALRAQVDDALEVAERFFNADAQGALMLRGVRALFESKRLLP